MPYHVPPSVLARSRSTISPLAETWGELMAVVHAARCHPRAVPSAADRGIPCDARASLVAWAGAAPGDEDLRRGLAELVASTKWLPDFVGITPPPSGEPELLDEIAVIAAWSDESYRATVRDSAAQSWLRHDLGWTRGDHLGERTAKALWDAWERFVEPDWARRREVLDREIAHRSALVAAHGWAAALEGMTRHLRWLDPDLLVISPRQEESLTLDSHLVFIPTTQPSGWWTCDGPVGLGLVYSARGTAAGERRPPERSPRAPGGTRKGPRAAGVGHSGHSLPAGRGTLPVVGDRRRSPACPPGRRAGRPGAPLPRCLLLPDGARERPRRRRAGPAWHRRRSRRRDQRAIA